MKTTPMLRTTLILTTALFAALFSSSYAADAPNGKALFDKTCAPCHLTGAAGAPKLGDSAAWAPRIKTGVAALFTSATKGKGVMPPRGGNAGVARARQTAVFLAHDQDARIVELFADIHRAILPAVIHDDQLEILESLRQHRANRLAHKAFDIIHRHHHRNGGLIGLCHGSFLRKFQANTRSRTGRGRICAASAPKMVARPRWRWARKLRASSARPVVT
mgnify:CR=1 FL=1